MEHLHVSQAKAGLFRGLGIEEDRRGNELANFEYHAIGGGDRRRHPA